MENGSVETRQVVESQCVPLSESLGVCPQRENAQFENNFTYHAPKEGQAEKYEAIRARLKETAYLLDGLCPTSREKSVAITKLEEAMFWANAAIARN